MFENFRKQNVALNDVNINCIVGGSGPPLLLLHGYPQTHVMWHKITSALTEKFTVVASDLRGYGDSDKPAMQSKHLSYSKKVMASDQVQLMHHLGFDQFFLAGHDRGGRVAHRMALDFPQVVRRLIVMDIAPTFTMYKQTDMEFAKAYYHWFFLIQPYDLPERLIGSDPEYFLIKKLGQWGRDSGAFSKEALKEYLRCMTPEMIHSSCEDYRASASIDLEHDQEDLDKGTKIICPLLVIWGSKGFVGNKYNMLHEWQNWGEDVSGYAISCGHYLPEEAPGQTLKAMLDFF